MEQILSSVVERCLLYGGVIFFSYCILGQKFLSVVLEVSIV